MLKLHTKFQYEYEMLLSEFAETLIRTTETQVLPPLLELPSLANINSAFRESVSPISVPSQPVGPRLANFLYVVPTAPEMQGLIANVENYGDDGVLDWRPFYPVVDSFAGPMSQQVATEENLLSLLTTVDNTLVSLLRETESRNNLSVLIVDIWALLLPRYQEILAQVDQQNFLNLAVLVVCNNADSNFQSAWPKLDQTLKMTFRYHMIGANQLWRLVRSAEEFDLDADEDAGAGRNRQTCGIWLDHR